MSCSTLQRIRKDNSMHATRVDEMSGNRVPRVGVGGPVRSGKTMLIERVVPILGYKGNKIGIVSNDVVSREDADRMRRNLALKQQLLPQELVIGLATVGMSSYCSSRGSFNEYIGSGRNGIQARLP